MIDFQSDLHPCPFFLDCRCPSSLFVRKWSARLDSHWVDESEDAFDDNMVRLINEGFVFRKEMFKGGLTANDLAGQRRNSRKKKQKKEKKR